MKEQGKRKVIFAEVVSDKMNKTRVIVVERKLRHPKYGKVIVRRTRFKMHDEKNESKEGDRIKAEETRPLSKDKRWRLLEIL